MSEKKKILLITTTHTGCGHKSISDALMDWFVDMPEVEVKPVDGFEDLVASPSPRWATATAWSRGTPSSSGK